MKSLLLPLLLSPLIAGCPGDGQSSAHPADAALAHPDAMPLDASAGDAALDASAGDAALDASALDASAGDAVTSVDATAADEPTVLTAQFNNAGDFLTVDFSRAIAIGSGYPAAEVDEPWTVRVQCESCGSYASHTAHYLSGDGSSSWVFDFDGLVAARTDNILLDFAPVGEDVVEAVDNGDDLDAFTDKYVQPPLLDPSPPTITSVTADISADTLTVNFDIPVRQGALYPNPDGTSTDGPWGLRYTVYPTLDPWYPTCLSCDANDTTWVLNAGLDMGANDDQLGVTLDYDSSTGDVVEAHSDGTDMLNRTDIPITLAAGPVIPTFSSAHINPSNQSQIIVNFSSAVREGANYNNSHFAVSGNSISSVSGSGGPQWTINVGSPINFGSSVTLSFVQPSGGDSVESTIAPDYADLQNFSRLVDAQAQTTYYYLTSNGAGDNAGVGGTWTTNPISEGNAMSPAQFNDSNNWSATENATKIDSDDVVYIKGGGWGDNRDLFVQGAVTLDGYEAGDCDAINTNCPGSTTVGGATIFVLGANDVTIRDIIFTNPTWTAHIATRNVGVPEYWTRQAYKVERFQILSNRFLDQAGTGGAIWLQFGVDVLISGNYYIGNGGCHDGSSDDFISLQTGTRITIANNSISNGNHGIYIQHGLNVNQDNTIDYPAGGGYSIDPEANLVDLEVAYNLFGSRCDEGISHDGADGNTESQNVDVDTVSNISGNIVTLANSGWSARDLSGMYMTSYDRTDIHNHFGRIALIESQNGQQFTVSDASIFAQGQPAAIGLVNHRPWVHHNRFEDGAGGYGLSSIYYEDLSSVGLIENNRSGPRASWHEGHGASVATKRQYMPMFSVTGTYPNFHSTFNVIRYNTLGDIMVGSLCQEPACPGGATASPSDVEHNYNNSMYDNLLWHTDHGQQEVGEVRVTNATTYLNNNKWVGKPWNASIRIPVAGGVVDTVDRAANTPSTVYSNHPPNILRTRRLTGNSLEVTFTKSVNGCTAGDCGFVVEKNGSPISINCTGGSGATRTFSLGATLTNATSAFIYYNGTGDIADGNGNVMYKFMTVGHDLMTEY